MNTWRTSNVASRQKSEQGQDVNDNDQQTVYSERDEEVKWLEGVPVFYTAANEEEDRLFHLVHVGDAEAVATFMNVRFGTEVYNSSTNIYYYIIIVTT